MAESSPEPVPDVNVREFALAVMLLIDQWHRKPHDWIEQCACGERWPCKAKDAWLAGAEAMRAVLDELDQLRAAVSFKEGPTGLDRPGSDGP